MIVKKNILVIKKKENIKCLVSSLVEQKTADL